MKNVQLHRRPPARSIVAFVSCRLGGRGPAGGVGGVGGVKTDRGLCLSWSPAHSVLYFRRMAPRFLRHTGESVFGGRVCRRVAATLTCVGIEV